MRAGLSFLYDEGEWTEVLVLEAPVGGANTHECTRRVHDGLHPVLEEAREEIIIGAQIRPPTWLIAELLTLAVLSTLRARLLRSEDWTGDEFAGELMTHVVEPYLAKGAARIDEQRDGRVRSRIERTEMVPIRPHPRTMQALRAIASAPALSSREVGRAVGVDNNSGHITKLLARLERRALIENASYRRTERERSTWFLTPYGQRVLEVVARTYGQAQVDVYQAAAERASALETPRSANKLHAVSVAAIDVKRGGGDEPALR